MMPRSMKDVSGRGRRGPLKGGWGGCGSQRVEIRENFGFEILAQGATYEIKI
jgi:hypothetical protein